MAVEQEDLLPDNTLATFLFLAFLLSLLSQSLLSQIQTNMSHGFMRHAAFLMASLIPHRVHCYETLESLLAIAIKGQLGVLRCYLHSLMVLNPMSGQWIWSNQ